MGAQRIRGPVQILLPLLSQRLDQLLPPLGALPRQPQVVLAPAWLRSGERGRGHGRGLEPAPPPADPAPPLALLSQWRLSGPRAPRPLTSTGCHICCSTTELGTQPGKRMGRCQYCRWSTAGQVEGLDSTCPRDHAGRAPRPPAQLCPPDVQELSWAHTPCP